MNYKDHDFKPTSQEAYEHWHERLEVDGDTNTPWHTLIKKYLDPSRDLEGKRVLEIGCGRGGFACWLATQHRTCSIVAADFATSAIKKAHSFASKRQISGIYWEVSDIESIAHPDNTFDTVISCETIEHVPDSRRAIKELARVLKPGGRMFLTTPNYLGPFGLYRVYLRLRGQVFTEEGQPINNFMILPRTRSWVVGAGLRVKAIDAVGHYALVPNRPPIELTSLNNPRILMRWLAHHSLIIAEKP